MTVEVNFDGIVGPTHNYSGLSYGNVASLKNQHIPSNPKKAALQGLEKMHYLMGLGIPQGVLPPQERPAVYILRELGFSGSDEQVLQRAYKENRALFFACNSASSMWAANAATFSPSSDSQDGRFHITPANLSNKFHRSIETAKTSLILKKLLPDENLFVHHPALPAGDTFADEGAANHSRLCKKFGNPGIQLFVYGRAAFNQATSTQKFPARHTFESSQAIARFHQLDQSHIIFAQQHPLAIDAGVFHNDVIAVAHQNLLLFHEFAFLNSDQIVAELRKKFSDCCRSELQLIKVTELDVPLEDAVASYLFNSQIVTLQDQTMRLLAPTECQETPSVKLFLDNLVKNPDNPIQDIHYFNLRESMRNGGGPACLRIRAVMNEQELQAANSKMFLTPQLFDQLVSWVERHYRDQLLPEDLLDPQLHLEGKTALDELTKLLNLGSIYSFQI